MFACRVLFVMLLLPTLAAAGGDELAPGNTVEPLSVELPDSLPAPEAPESLPPVVGREAAIEAATLQYRATGEAPVLERSASVVYPYGESLPIVTCSPLRACDIELEAGEAVTGVALGDTERWVVSPLSSGDAEEPTPHVIVKPKSTGLATNLVIGTNRRTYHLGLVSPPTATAEAGHATYHRHVTFYYPSELVEQWTSREELERRREARAGGVQTAELAAVSVSELNFDYTIRPDRKVTFSPTTVFDDGSHVYIQLPSTVRSGDLPALLVTVDGGTLAVSNYRVQDLWYVVDGLFERAELVVGVGKNRQRVRITNDRWPGA